MKTPDISIIIPVYNVEPYLRQCLDSVVNQTLSDIQVICVNDGSMDGSLAILEEYAANDSRITIINQENQGLGAARNNAISSIQGIYTCFVDSDDWLRLDMCEKTFQMAEKLKLDIAYFRMKGTSVEAHSPKFDPKLPELRIASTDRTDLLLYFTSACTKLWKSQLLISENIRFPNTLFEDVLPSWKGCILAQRVAVLNETLYFRRIRPGSIMQTRDASHYAMVDVMNAVEKMLKEQNLYAKYQDAFLQLKLSALRRIYLRLAYQYQKPFQSMIRNALTDDDRDFLQTASPRQGLSRKVKLFYQTIENQSVWGRFNLYLLGTGARMGRWARSNCFVPLKHFLAGIFSAKKGVFPKIHPDSVVAVDVDAPDNFRIELEHQTNNQPPRKAA